MAVLVVAAGVLGLLVGSFLNVVIHRVPRGESVVRPPSHCPGCGQAIKARHNVPVVGWLVLRGRCAGCGTRISVRYPLVELGTAVLFALLALRLDPPALPAFLYFGAIGIALALIDLDVRRLPDAIVLPSYPVLLVLLAASAWWRDDWWSLARAGIGGAALFAFYLLLALAYPAGMGFGDVKLAGILGGILAYLSWPALLVGAFGGFLLGALAGVVVLATRKGGRKTALPFGPFMIAAALLAIFAAGPLGAAYLRLTGLA
ncbi:type 4 prepilin peptidase 1 Aspartic peptidase. MEROPS family A24A [Amycolatopsis tolypomycina]|uniref:Prepilin leader peptidase/N-methyltransferase n=1 Tax=Amycolatopsis tolypomycina TaxID=208445 RepID=A0A1H4WBW3_9PSEU|nr:A24 family peptidase [Amycolatopsis tolypomycina]SEC90238.1 type 4 prepilin peptidase 1 Aspartic peptidase. MEROPS family A24A [Amycolatopsis tolypomycina]